jgi:cytochrome c oxidase subunit 2
MKGQAFMLRFGIVTVSVVALVLTASPDGQTATKTLDIVAERFSFTPSDIVVEPGTALELRITSEDTIHGFKVTGPSGPTDIDVEIPKRNRGDVRVTFVPKEAGTYVFECSRICGAGHGFMRGTIRVRARQGS